MPKYLSGRSKKTPPLQIKGDRYRYLSVEDAEPNLGDPAIDGAVPPFGPQYQNISVLGYPGERYWIPIGGGLIPGSISIFDESTIVGGLNSTTQLNFVGLAVTAIGNSGENPGIAVTIRVFAPGNNQELLFNSSNEFGTSPKLTFNSSNGLLTAGDQIIVGAGGTVITATSGGLIGIGTPNPTQELDVNGDVRIRGTIYDYNNQPGLPTQVIIKNSLGGLFWTNQDRLRAGAGGTYRNVQFHNSAGLVDGTETFVYDEVNSRVGIGSTLPQKTLDVIGSSRFTGPTEINFLNVTGVTTTTTLAVAGTSTTRNLIVTGVTTLGFLTGTSAYYTGIVTAVKFVGNLNADQVYVTGISTFNGNVTLGDANTDTVTFNSRINSSVLPLINGTLNLGAALYEWDNVYANIFVGDLDGNAGTSTKLATIRNISITGDLAWNVNFDGSGNVTGIGTLANTGVFANTYGADTVVPVFTVDSKGRITSVTNTGINFSNATVAQSDKIKTLTTATNASFYPTFVDSNNSVSGYEALYTDVGIYYNPSTDLLTLTNLTVDSNTSLKDLSISGKITSSVLPSPNATLNLGAAIFKWDSVYANTFVGNLNGKLVNARNIAITGDLGWNVNFDGSANVTAVGTLANTTVAADTYGNTEGTSYGRFTVDAKGRITSASNVGVNFTAATVLNSDNIKTVATGTNASFYPTFVDSNNSVAAYEALYTDAGISYNPSTDLLSLGNLTVSATSTFNGNVILGDVNTDTVTFNSRINSSVLPLINSTSNVDVNGKDLGGTSNRWRTVYANDFDGRLIGNADTASKLATARNIAITGDLGWSVTFDGSGNVTSTGTLATVNSNIGTWGNTEGTSYGRFTVDAKGRITSASNVGVNFTAATVANSDKIKAVATEINDSFYPTFVDSNNSSASYESLYTDAGISYNPYTDLLTLINLNITGNVILGNANTDTVTFNSRINSSVLPTGNGAVNLGAADSKWNNIYANSFVGAIIGNADTATKLQTARNIAITGDLGWTVSFDGSGPVTGAGTLANSGVTANTYGSSTTVPVFAVDSKGRITSASNVAVGGFDGSGSATQANTIKTVATSIDAPFRPTFVDSHNTTAAYESLYTDSGISYNPYTNLLDLINLTVTNRITGSITGDAVTLGGLALNTDGRADNANEVVRTDGNGYIQAGWINSTSGDLGVQNRLDRVYTSNDQYIRYLSLVDFKNQMGLSAKNNYSRRVDYSSDLNYSVGSMGHSGYGANETFHGGSGFFDIWSGTNFPGSYTHIHGINMLHYTVNSLGSTGGNAYGWQLATQYNDDSGPYFRRCNGGTFSGWRKIWHDTNDGSGSGLDADLLDGYNTAVSNTGSTIPVRDSAGGITHTYYSSAYSGGNSGLTRSSYPYTFGFQESGAWSNPYPDLVLQYHTGVTLAGNPTYEGIRFKNDYNDDTVRFQINGVSSYTYKYTWMKTNTTGFYSDTNSWHIYPNDVSSYGGTELRGSKNGWRGIHFYDGGKTPHLMFDGNANGGFYYETDGRWSLYYDYSRSSWGVNTSTTSASYAIYTSGNIYATGTITAASDGRKKKEVETISNALDKVSQLRGVTYKRTDYKDDDTNYNKTEMGVIAQEVEPIVPEVVTYAEDVDEYAVSYGNFAGLFIEAIKEQNAIINTLKAEIEQLKSKLEK